MLKSLAESEKLLDSTKLGLGSLYFIFTDVIGLTLLPTLLEISNEGSIQFLFTEQFILSFVWCISLLINELCSIFDGSIRDRIVNITSIIYTYIFYSCCRVLWMFHSCTTFTYSLGVSVLTKLLDKEHSTYWCEIVSMLYLYISTLFCTGIYL